MTTSNTRELDFARGMIINYLSNGENADSLYAIFQIQQGDKEELLEHIEAILSIFSKAKEQLEKEMKNGN